MSVEKMEKLDSLKEFSDLFSGQEISEDFKFKAETLFEAAVVSKVNEEIDKINTKVLAEQEEAKKSLEESLTTKVDQYLDLSVDKWINENTISITNGIRLDTYEKFMNGLKDLFKECYVDVPDEKLDYLASLETQVSSLKDKVNEQIEVALTLNSQLLEMKKDKVIAECVADLAKSEQEKFKTLCEGIKYEDDKSFAAKLVVIKEKHYPITQPTTSVVVDTPLVEKTQSDSKLDLKGDDLIIQGLLSGLPKNI